MDRTLRKIIILFLLSLARQPAVSSPTMQVGIDDFSDGFCIRVEICPVELDILNDVLVVKVVVC